MSEPRDEREFNTSLEVHTPSWAPGVKANISFRRLWDKRIENFVEKTARLADVSPEQVAVRVDEADEFANVFALGVERCGSHGEGSYSDFISKLVAAALYDDARVSDVSWILDKMQKFQPIHIRLIVAMPTPDAGDDERKGPLSNTRDIASACNCSSGVALGVLGELIAYGFVELAIGPGTLDTLGEGIRLTPLGVSLLDLVAEVDASLKARE